MAVTVPIQLTGYTRVPEILGIGITATAIGALSVITRFIVRLRIRGGLWWDDWLILIGMMFVIIDYTCIATDLRYGLGRHVQDLPKDIDFHAPRRIQLIIEESYLLSWGFVKMAMCFFLLRVFNEKLRVPVYVVMSYVVLATLATCIACLLQCVPLNKYWNPAVSGFCGVNEGAWGRWSGVVNIISDIALYLLPIRTVWKTSMPRRKKIGIIVLFGVGFLVVLIGFLRLKSLGRLSESNDVTWVTVGPNMWSIMEINLAIFVTSAPAMKPVYDFILRLTDGPKPAAENDMASGDTDEKDKGKGPINNGNKPADNSVSTVEALEREIRGGYRRDILSSLRSIGGRKKDRTQTGNSIVEETV